MAHVPVQPRQYLILRMSNGEPLYSVSPQGWILPEEMQWASPRAPQYTGFQPLRFSGGAYLHESALSIQRVIKYYLGFDFVVVVLLHNIRKSLHTSWWGWKGTCELRCAILWRYSEINNQHLGLHKYRYSILVAQTSRVWPESQHMALVRGRLDLHTLG